MQYLEAIEDSHLDAAVFAAAAKLGINYDMVEELYQGQHESDEDFTYHVADDMGLVPEGNDWPVQLYRLGTSFERLNSRLRRG